MWTQPTKAEGKYSRRGEVYATVTHRPAQQKFGVVAFEMGYPFAPGKELSVSIDGGSAIRIPADEDEDSEDESIMWHPSSEVNRRLVGAMRDGLTMVAAGRSKRGTKTVDTYSLRRVLGCLQGDLARLQRTLTARPAPSPPLRPVHNECEES